MIRLESDKHFSTANIHPNTDGTFPCTITHFKKISSSCFLLQRNGGLRLEWSWRSAVPDIDQQSIKQTPAVKGTNKGNYHPRLQSHSSFYFNFFRTFLNRDRAIYVFHQRKCSIGKKRTNLARIVYSVPFHHAI